MCAFMCMNVSECVYVHYVGEYKWIIYINHDKEVCMANILSETEVEGSMIRILPWFI